MSPKASIDGFSGGGVSQSAGENKMPRGLLIPVRHVPRLTYMAGPSIERFGGWANNFFPISEGKCVASHSDDRDHRVSVWAVLMVDII